MATGMLIDGVAASEAIDSSGEILDVEGCDISTLDTEGVLNWEHRGDDSPGHSPSDIVGKIVYAKKIFDAKDCENERQSMYWQKLELPFVYIIARLYDGAGHQAAKDMAAQIRDHHANGDPILVRYSIEGSTMSTSPDKKHLLTSVARRVAATIKPCNRSAHSGLLLDPNAPSGFEKTPVKVEKDFLDDVLKRSEYAHPNFTPLGGATVMQVDPVLSDEFLPVKKTAAEDETKRIAERRKTDEAQKPHKFRAAKWTHPNGHPRCSLCGDEERTDGQCPGAASDDINKTDVKDTSCSCGDCRSNGCDPECGHCNPPEQPVAKAMTAGSYNAAPGSLTNGAALQREDMGLRVKVRSALKSWDKKSSIREHLKSEIPEASDEFIERFADLVDKYTVPKKLTKAEPLQGQALIRKFEALTIDLRKAVEEVKKDSGWGELEAHRAPEQVEFRGKKMKPGHGSVGWDRAMFVGHDKDHFYAVPKEKMHAWQPEDVMKLPRAAQGLHFSVESPPLDLDSQPIVDAKKHGVPHNRHPEQEAILHGMDLSGQGVSAVDAGGKNGVNASRSAWYKGGHGIPVYVKGAPGGPFSESHREVVYHNMAKDFFGLGAHVPSVAGFMHPVTGEHQVAVERIKGHHPEFREHRGGVAYTARDPQVADAIRSRGRDGTLDKLALMNHVLGNTDRHQHNWMMGDDGHVKLLDHGYAFTAAPDESIQLPDYWEKYGHQEWADGDMNTTSPQEHLHNKPLHPGAVEWLNGLSHEKLGQMLAEHQVPDYLAADAQARLMSLQQAVRANPNVSRWAAWNAHIIQPDVPAEPRLPGPSEDPKLWGKK